MILPAIECHHALGFAANNAARFAKYKVEIISISRQKQLTSELSPMKHGGRYACVIMISISRMSISLALSATCTADMSYYMSCTMKMNNE